VCLFITIVGVFSSRENVFESNLCSLYVSLPLCDIDVDVDDGGT